MAVMRLTRVVPVLLALLASRAVSATELMPLAEVRPGMQGVAKIEAGRQSAGWVLTHRIIDWLRLALWSWVG